MTQVQRLVALAVLVVTLAVPFAGATPAHAELVWVGPSAAHIAPLASWAGCSHNNAGCPQ